MFFFEKADESWWRRNAESFSKIWSFVSIKKAFGSMRGRLFIIILVWSCWNSDHWRLSSFRFLKAYRPDVVQLHILEIRSTGCCSPPCCKKIVCQTLARIKWWNSQRLPSSRCGNSACRTLTSKCVGQCLAWLLRPSCSSKQAKVGVNFVKL